MGPVLIPARTRRNVAIASTLALLVGSAVASPVAASRPIVTTEINNHFHNEFRVEPGACPYPGVSIVADGNERLVVVDDGVTLKVHYGESFKYTETWDGGAYPPDSHSGTDSLVFVVDRDGDTFFHESFHDFGPVPWDPDSKIRGIVTFKTVDGEVLVDHEIATDMPPAGC